MLFLNYKRTIMKKLFIVITIAFLSIHFTNAQEASYGAVTGYNSFTAKASFNGVSSSVSESGIFFGVFADFSISEKFHVQPELQYVVIFANGDSGNELVIPIMAKYYFTDKFNFQAGPQFDVILDESPGIKALGFGLGFGLGYDFSDKLFATTRYSIGLNNRLENTDVLDGIDPTFSLSGLKTKFNFFQIGLGYRF